MYTCVTISGISENKISHTQHKFRYRYSYIDNHTSVQQFSVLKVNMAGLVDGMSDGKKGEQIHG